MKPKYFLKQFSALAIAASVIATSCSKKLDEPTSPNTIQAEKITANDIPGLTLGIYTNYATSGISRIYLLSDIYSDNMASTATGYSFFDLCNIPINDTRINELMIVRYRAIGNANLVINAINDNNFQGLNQYKGQALLMRAYCYLELAKHFGGVVITTGKEGYAPRKQNTVGEVYDFAIRDLKEAIDNNLLPSFTNAAAGNMQAAKAVLARTYLQLGKNTEAKALALDVIQNSGGISLTTTATFASNFISTGSDASKELLLKIQEGPIVNPTQNGLYGSYNYANFATPTSYVINTLYEATDVRRSFVSSGKLTKFLSDASPIYPLIRLSEVYLIAAEADARLGTIDVTYYNAVRAKRGVAQKLNSDFATPALFLTEIANERNREFMGESLRWEDMKRFGLAQPHLQSLGVLPGHIIFPMPESQRATNILLDQNPDY